METPPKSTSPISATGVSPTESGPAELRKPRAVLSCVACRNRKLRCDRNRPCSNCSKRKQTCRYFTFAPSGKNIPPVPSKESSGIASHLDRRLQHLEDLLVTLNTQQNPDRRTSASTVTMETELSDFGIEEQEEEVYLDLVRNRDDEAARCSNSSPSNSSSPSQNQSKVSSGQWQAILDDISELRSFLLREGSLDASKQLAAQSLPLQTPVLLLSTMTPISRPDLMASLPPRAVADQLIINVFSYGEPAISILHVPTFMQDYHAFWSDTDSVSLAWLAKLFALLCLSTLFQLRQGLDLPELLDGDTCDLFRVRAAQCLIKANYIQPGPDKVEALILYMASEFFKSKDAQLGVSIIIGVIVRLEMSMGYHRDPSRNPSISVFEGEMIRRRWAFITQVERLTSFQMGLPTMVYRAQTDTRPPHNLLDTDFDASSTSLSTERPEWEITPISYIIAKEKAVKAFAFAVDSLKATKSLPYKGILQLDLHLQKVRSTLPPFFKLRPLSESRMESIDILVKRYFFELLFLKGRCVLHRQYLTNETGDATKGTSRLACLDAARQILRHQVEVYRETQAGATLAHARSWLLSTLTTSDFLLAAMIVSLSISQARFAQDAGYDSATLGFPANDQLQRTLVQELATSQRIWIRLGHDSAEASRASEAVGLMLAQAQSKATRSDGLQSNAAFMAMSTQALAQPAFPITSRDEDLSHVINTSTGFDWETWDRYFQAPPPHIVTSVPMAATTTSTTAISLVTTSSLDVPSMDAFSDVDFANFQVGLSGFNMAG